MKKVFLIVAFFLLVCNSIPGNSAVKVNQEAPNFTLPNIEGKMVSLTEFKGKHIVLEWTNYGCPFVKKHYHSGNMPALQNEFTKKGVIWISICSSAKGKEGNLSSAEWKEKLIEYKSAASAVLLDENGRVGHLYGAKTTPHMFVIDPKGILIYQGAIDSIASHDPADIPNATNYVRQALNETMAGKPVVVPQTESYGCSVKY